MQNENKKPTTTIGTRRVVSYFWKMTMTRKRPFIIASIGMVITSLMNLLLPIYYTRIVDVVQTATSNRMEFVPILMGILVTMGILEL